MIASFDLPLSPVPARNSREHWRAVAKRGKAEKGAVLLVFKMFSEWTQLRQAAAHGATVTLTRFYGKGCRSFDDDNIRDAFKAVRDQVAKCLKQSDAPQSPLVWEYRQERVPQAGALPFVRVMVAAHPGRDFLVTVEARP
jgi:hypothetical protein